MTIDEARMALRIHCPHAQAEAHQFLCLECAGDIANRLDQMEAALTPFAARVHPDGVDAPYPEETWRPVLQAASDALR